MTDFNPPQATPLQWQWSGGFLLAGFNPLIPAVNTLVFGITDRYTTELGTHEGAKMVRTHTIPCHLPHAQADAFNRESGRIYTGVLVAHWRVVRKKAFWLSEKAGTVWSDRRITAKMHAHTIDAAQQGFFKACAVTRALRKIGFTAAKFPYHRRKFRTTIWKNTAIKRRGHVLELSNGRGGAKIVIVIPEVLRDVLRFLEVRLVYDKLARRYTWHIVVENGKQPKAAPGHNVVAVDLGEVHPAVVADAQSAVIITCRERRHESQGHARRLAKSRQAASRKRKGSRRHKRLVRARARMRAKHARVMRDMKHKISRAVVDAAVERKAGTIVLGDVRDVADGAKRGKKQNGRLSRWDHGKIRQYIEYKAQAEGITVKLEDEAYTTQTCPNCQARHKPGGRTYCCPSCGIQAHRDVVGAVNILSVFRHGEPGKIPAPAEVNHRMPHNLRLMRRCRDTGQAEMPVAREQFREAVGF
jgi:putative transposase